MLTISQIKELFKDLNQELSRSHVKGEVGICGGAVMCLVFKSRPATKDVDAIFKPTAEIREAARRVARDYGLKKDWLNDAAKAYFHADPPKETVLEFSHLRVWAPRADYMLAMKCLSARYDSHDREDVEFLIQYLGLKNAEEVFDKVVHYYPKERIPAKTVFLVEELFSREMA